MNIKELLGQGAFWTINKALAKKIGVKEALLLSDLIDKYYYFKSRNELIIHENNEYFYATSTQIKNNTTFTYKTQKKCIFKLKTMGYIKTHLTGMPAKQHFTLCESQFFPKGRTSIAQKDELVLPKRTSIIHENINNNNRNNNTHVESIKKLFNENCPDLPKIKIMTTTRKTAIKNNIKNFTLKNVEEVIKKTGRSNYLNGGSARGWKASYDWIMKPANFCKILEGNYDNKPKKINFDIN